MDSRAIELVSWELKKKFGPLAYVVAGLKAVRESKPAVTAECESLVSGELVLLGNGRFYGGSFAFFPEASMKDGRLDICVFPRITWRRVAHIVGGMLTGRVHRWRSALHLQSSQVRLTSPSRVALQLDGENVGELPATLSVLPKALRVVVP